MARRTAGAFDGLFFHSFDETGDIKWQGRILSTYPNGCKVETYSWFDGEPCSVERVTYEDMDSWVFYDTLDEMNEAYEFTRRVRGRCDD